MDDYDGGSHEANIVHAALDAETGDVQEGVAEMTRSETRRLLQAANTIAAECSKSLRENGDEAVGTLIAHRS